MAFRRVKLSNLQPQRRHPRPREALRTALSQLVAEYGIPGYLARQIGIGETALSNAAAGKPARRSTLTACERYVERLRERRVVLAFTGLASDDEMHQLLPELREWLRGRDVVMSVVGRL